MGNKSQFQADAAMDDVNGPSAGRSSKLTAKEKKKLSEMLAVAKDMKEMALIERAINEGRLPPGLQMDLD